MRIEENQRALDYINDAFNYYESNQMKYETAMVKMNFAEALYAIGKKEEAIENLFESEKLFVALNNKQETNRVYEMLADQLREKEDFKGALEYQRKYTDGLKYFFLMLVFVMHWWISLHRWISATTRGQSLRISL